MFLIYITLEDIPGSCTSQTYWFTEVFFHDWEAVHLHFFNTFGLGYICCNHFLEQENYLIHKISH